MLVLFLVCLFFKVCFCNNKPYVQIIIIIYVLSLCCLSFVSTMLWIKDNKKVVWERHPTIKWINSRKKLTKLEETWHEDHAQWSWPQGATI